MRAENAKFGPLCPPYPYITERTVFKYFILLCCLTLFISMLSVIMLYYPPSFVHRLVEQNIQHVNHLIKALGFSSYSE